MIKILFWLSFGIVFYAFLGYGILLYFLVKIKKSIKGKHQPVSQGFLPEVSLVVPCYNEAPVLREKVLNTFQLEYDPKLLRIYFITDGSNDGSREVLTAFPQVNLLHEDRRAGKTAAENRAMRIVSSPFVIFTDANTMLNKLAVKNMIRHFEDERVGCVAGEKRVLSEDKDTASAAGEGMYWKYESFLKMLDSELYSAVGAAGELVAFRTSLYEELPEDTILDDFMQSLLIASKGYKIIYEPEAYAMETASASVKDELKRKIRISAGGWQSMKRLWTKITLWRQPVLYFQYLSHRVLRWTVTPFLLVLMFFLNMLLWKEGGLYQLFMVGQGMFYLAAVAGHVMENRQIRLKVLFIPYYFCLMNYAVVAGLLRFLAGGQQGIWEKAKRKERRP